MVVKHRNLLHDFSSNTAVVEDILERGSLKDWRELADAIRRDPTGPYARAVKRVLASTHFFGTTNLWQDFLERISSQNPASGG